MTDTITPESLRALADRPVILQMGPGVSGALRAAADEIERLQRIAPNGKRRAYVLPSGLVAELRRTAAEESHD